MKKQLVKNVKKVLTFGKQLIEQIKWILRFVLRTDHKNHISTVSNANILTILANGPSLTKDFDNIDFSIGHFSVVNDFYKSPWYAIIKPSYHVLADPLYFTKDEELQPFVDAVKWNMKLFVPYSAWKRMKMLRNIPNHYIEVVPYHTLVYNGFNYFKNWAYKHGFSMPIAQNVLVPSIFNAINMGYKEIRLYGVDHSWTESIRVNETNQVCLTDSHFYDNEKIMMEPWRKTTPGREIYRMHEILRDLAQMFDSYFDIRNYADECGCKIINCTKKSFIDAFERA